MFKKCPFQKAVEECDITALAASLTEDVTFYSSVTALPYKGIENVMPVLSLGAEIFVFKDDFSYINAIRDRNTLLLTFQARIGCHEIDGVDYFELDKDDRVRVLRVMIRPLAALEAIARRAAEIRKQ